ncbi:hypothetical protein [Nocardioides endophyticus]|uniref:hypothetical protein n=1 Tax=Nocardioides endophyticus TaxID=1353775 RepID=UPI0031EB4D3D
MAQPAALLDRLAQGDARDLLPDHADSTAAAWLVDEPGTAAFTAIPIEAGNADNAVLLGDRFWWTRRVERPAGRRFPRCTGETVTSQASRCPGSDGSA